LGNHDVDWRISDIAETYGEIDSNFPVDYNRKLYQKISAKIAELFLKKNSFSEKGPAPFSGIIDKEDMIIFVLNSGWQSRRHEKIPHGKVEIKQLRWFGEKASLYRDNDAWKILLLHHHPQNYPNMNPFHDTSFLEEGSEIIQIAGESGFNIICHGHRHHPKAINNNSNDWLNPITFICAGSCSVNASKRHNGEIPNCFHIIELINGEKIVKLKNYEYSSSEGWKVLTNNRPEAPLDGVMFFCKTYSSQDREKELKKLIDEKNNREGYELPEWSNLPIELKTLNYHNLNYLIRNVYNERFVVYGDYPKKVALIRREKCKV